MNDLPPGWALRPLRELADISGGLMKGKKRRGDEVLREVPYLRVANVQRGSLDLTEVKLIEATESEIEQLKLRRGDVLFNEGGDRDKLGRGCVWNAELPECINQNHVFRARVRDGAALPAWISAFGNSDEAQAYFLASGKQTTNLASISMSTLGSLPIPTPPLNEQRRIVAKLESLQSRSRRAREALDAVPPLLEKLRQSILAAAFRGDLTKDWRAQNPNPEPATALLARIRTERRQKWEASELAKLKAKGKAPTNDSWKAKYKEPEPVDATGLPELPEGWCWASLDELVVDGPTNGFSPKSEGAGAGTLTLKLSATTLGLCRLNDQTTKRTVEPIGVDEPYWLEPGDVLIQRANTLENVGVAAIFDGPRRTYIYPDLMMRVRASAIVGPRLLWRALSWEFCRKHMRDRATGTAGNMPKVNGGTVRSIPIPLPPAEELFIVLDLVDALLAKRQRLERLVADLPGNFEGLERTILAKAFRGELVPQDPNDGPADAMLARLRSEAPADSSRQRARRSKAAE